jgi:hypothetical protein
MKYTSIDRILAKLNRDIGSFNEDDAIEWIGEALEFMETARSLQDSVAFIEVKNHEAILPNYFQSLIQIARYNGWDKSLANSLCAPKKILEEKCQNDFKYGKRPDCGCYEEGSPKPDYIVLDCEGKPLVDYDLAYYRPYFDLQWEYHPFTLSTFYRSKFTPVRPAGSNFFVVGHEQKEYNQIYQHSTDEFSVVMDSIRFSFKEGLVAVAYKKTVIDEDSGYPMIPDSISHLTAITHYIRMMLAQKDMDKGREGAIGRYDRATQKWQWYCKQAKNKDMIPKGDAEYQQLVDQFNTLLPRQNQYNKFFGANPQYRKRY